MTTLDETTQRVSISEAKAREILCKHLSLNPQEDDYTGEFQADAWLFFSNRNELNEKQKNAWIVTNSGKVRAVNENETVDESIIRANFEESLNEPLPLVPLDKSDDLAYDLFNNFHSSPEAFENLVEKLANEDLLLRVEVASRLFWHFKVSINSNVNQNKYLGLEASELQNHFLTSTRRETELLTKKKMPDSAETFDEIFKAFLSENSTLDQIKLFSDSDKEKLVVRFYILAALVAVMRAALKDQA